MTATTPAATPGATPATTPGAATAAAAGASAPARLARAFGVTVERLHRRLGGDAAVAALLEQRAAELWHAASEGHVCIETTPEEDAMLRTSPAVCEPARPQGAPLVLDAGALYLQRLWTAETGLARAIAALDEPAPVASAAERDRVLGGLFGGAAADDPQRRAAEAALTRRLSVVTGGPGTGKTTTLARLLVAFLRLRPEGRVCFAAPTGKAAARLAASLAAQLPQLDPEGELAHRVPAGGLTVHRLLGFGTGASRLAAGETPTLAHDLVIVDEASMLDVELAHRLAVSIPPGGRLVLAGDADQLASVEAGAVFAEVCTSGIAGVVRLVRNYRQLDAPHIVRLAAAVREAWHADVAAAAAGMFAGEPGAATALAEAALASYGPALDAARGDAAPSAVLEAFDRYRVLAALREGEWGVRGLNQAIAAGVRRRVHAPPLARWYPGRLVMVTRNEPGLGLYNGDVGVCLRREGALSVAFAASPLRWVPLLQMPEHEDAFAITVHKSQGSEFASVDLVPAPLDHPLNTRELLYTGITRARSDLRLWCEPAALARGAARPTLRHGRLGARIRDAAVAAGADPGASPP